MIPMTGQKPLHLIILINLIANKRIFIKKQLFL